MSEPLAALDPLRAVLQQRPFALFSDVDGTISPLAPTPWQARVTPRNHELLDRLSRRVLVAVISGRDLPDLQRMLRLPGIVYVGLHGLAWRIAGSDELAPEALPYRQHTLDAAAELAALKRVDGVAVEVKTVGLAFHYRKARNAAAARFEILRAFASSPAAGHFRVYEAIRAVELRPPLNISKGVALRRLADRFNVRGLLYLGDDLTDVDAFEEIRRLRSFQTVAASGIAVAHGEAPAAVAAAADYTLESVGRVEWLLGELAAVFDNEPSALSAQPSAPSPARADGKCGPKGEAER